MITYVKGDATNPKSSGKKMIVHCCNDSGAWGAGFVVALSKRWHEPETAYRLWAKKGVCTDGKFKLGSTQFVQVTHDTFVANIVGQHGYGGPDDKGYPFIRYEAIKEGLLQVAARAKEMHASVHMPRIGCGLAGGSWNVMETIIRETLVANDIDVVVYDLP